MSQAETIAPPRRLSKLQASQRLGIYIKAVDRLIELGELKTVDIPGLRTTVLESSVEDVIRRMRASESQAS